MIENSLHSIIGLFLGQPNDLNRCRKIGVHYGFRKIIRFALCFWNNTYIRSLTMQIME